jgi:hypothetical protein
LADGLDAKRQEVLADLFPAAKHMAALLNPKTTAPRRLGEIEYAAQLADHEVRRFSQSGRGTNFSSTGSR